MRLVLPASLTAICLACHPSTTAQLCPTPEGALTSPTTVTQIALTRSEGAPILVPAYTVLLTASGDAFYTGTPAVPVPGQFSGRLRIGDFSHLTGQLLEAGLAPTAPEVRLEMTEDCGSKGRLTLSLQTADGHFLTTAFCPASPYEERYAFPIYAAVAAIRWQSGLRQLQLGPSN